MGDIISMGSDGSISGGAGSRQGKLVTMNCYSLQGVRGLAVVDLPLCGWLASLRNGGG